jgi:hypothetical protein
MMWLDNIKIFLTLKWIYLYVALAFVAMPLIYKTQYDNIISCIGFFGCIILYYQERILEEAQT